MAYNPQQIEKKWQRIWEKMGIYKAPNKVRGKKNFYHLVMFPYPSGDLHIGHWFNFAPADVYARFKKMQGFNVLSPIGFDAFGLPAENAAIKRKIHPKTWTYKNIERMRKQLKSIGAIYDWSREIITCDSEYYHWTQWMFLQLYKKGLAYRAKVPANFCPSCKTVLANEQVVEGRCERCDSEVVQKEIEQWLFKITAYAEDLLKDLESVNWPEATKIMQRNWIGRSEGSEIKFQISNSKCQIPVFTTRADTLFGATYLVIAPEHQIVEELKNQILNFKEVKSYIEESQKKTELERTELIKEKTGVELKGLKAINPANNQEIPVFAADYVLVSYGTGAIMAVPAHDRRDFEFAKKYKLPIIEVVSIDGKEHILSRSYEGSGILINSGRFNGQNSEKAKWEISKFVGGKKTVNYHLRDWLISRQRYWGAPIPMIFCPKCGWQPVPEKDLPVLLPKIKNFQPTGEEKSPLAKSKKFVEAVCSKCKGFAQRETDTMDTFVCSSWYFLRYVDPKNEKKFALKEKIRAWLPVDMYIGGAEHSVLHLLYSRFFTKALRDLGYLDFKEPFLSLRHQGIILGPDGQKMSKSRGNIVDPDIEVKRHGSDVVRMYLCFMGSYNQGGPWNPRGIEGIVRFLRKVWNLKAKNFKSRSGTSSLRGGQMPNFNNQNSKLEKLIHKTIKRVTEDIENFRFNTAVSTLMILVNEFEKQNQLSVISYQSLLKLLAPMAPYITEELWQKTGGKGSIHSQKWLKYDSKLVKEETITLIIQINGKVRDKIETEADISENEAKELAFLREKVQKWIKGREIKKVIFVPGKLINIVI